MWGFYRVGGNVEAARHLPDAEFTIEEAEFHNRATGRLPEELATAVGTILEMIANLAVRIRVYDRQLEALAEELYPETRLLRQVSGVGR